MTQKNPAAVALGTLGGRARSEKKKEASKRNGFQKGWRKALENQNKLKEL